MRLHTSRSLPTLSYRLLVIWIVLASLLPAQVAHAQSPVSYRRFHTELTLQENGDLHVRLIQQIYFEGEFGEAFFAIPKRNVTAIEDIEVYAAVTPADNENVVDPELAPIDFIATDEGDEILVEWSYPRTRFGELRLFVIEYVARGALWVYRDRDILGWDAIYADRGGVDVDAATVTVRLPASVPMWSVEATASGAVYELDTRDDDFVYTVQGSLPDGDFFNVELSFPHGLLAAEPQAWQKEADAALLDLTINRFDGEITIQPDGTVAVHEQMTVTVERGVLYEGYRQIRLLYVEDISDIAISANGEALAEASGDCENCFTVERTPRPSNWVYYSSSGERIVIQEENSGAVEIAWNIPPVYAGESATFDIRYNAEGALRINPDSQLLTWVVVPDYGAEVEEATLRVNLPPGVDPTGIIVEGSGPQGSGQMDPSGALLVSYDGQLFPGEWWEIALTLPANATSATPPPWQTELEAAIAESDAAAAAAARRRLLVGIVTILAAIASGAGAILLWLHRGRQRVREAVKGYVSEPPSDLAPGVVAYLVERKATPRSILAALFALANTDALEIDLTNGFTLRRVRNEPISAYGTHQNNEGQTVTTGRHMAYLFNNILSSAMPLNEPVALATIEPALSKSLPEFYAELARDVQRLFIDVPGGRGPAPVLPIIIWLALSSLIFLASAFGVFSLGTAAILVVVGLAITRAIGVSTGMRRYSDAGEAEAEKWVKFKNYLLNIKEYGDLAAAQEILDRYFAYAVALGVDESLLAYAEEIGAATPSWLPVPSQPQQSYTDRRIDDRPMQRRVPGRASSLPSVFGRRPQPDLSQRPNLSGMSRKLGDSISSASASLGQLLNQAAGDSAGRTVTFDSQYRRREMRWKPGASVSTVVDDILRQGISDMRQMREERRQREAAARAARSSSSSSSSRGSGSSSSSSSSSRSRSSGGFGSSHSSSSSRSSSSSSSRRSGGGGRSGFR